jgi:hypothetical protein
MKEHRAWRMWRVLVIFAGLNAPCMQAGDTGNNGPITNKNIPTPLSLTTIVLSGHNPNTPAPTTRGLSLLGSKSTAPPRTSINTPWQIREVDVPLASQKYTVGFHLYKLCLADDELQKDPADIRLGYYSKTQRGGKTFTVKVSITNKTPPGIYMLVGTFKDPQNSIGKKNGGAYMFEVQ